MTTTISSANVPNITTVLSPSNSQHMVTFLNIEADAKCTPFCRRHFKCIFLNENVWTSIKILVKFIPKCRIDNIPALVQIMAWRRQGDKPLFESMMVRSLTHICITRPQWVKWTLSDNHQTPYTFLCKIRKFLSENFYFYPYIRYIQWILPLCTNLFMIFQDLVIENIHCWPQVRNVLWFEHILDCFAKLIHFDIYWGMPNISLCW